MGLTLRPKPKKQLTGVGQARPNPVALAAARKTLKSLQSRMTQYLKFEPGKTKIRILPCPGSDIPLREVYKHFRVGPGNDKYCVCPKHTEGKHKDKRCPICEAAEEANRRGDNKTYRELMPGPTYVANAVNLVEPDSGVKLAQIPATVARILIDHFTDEEEGGDFSDPDVGANVTVNHIIKGKQHDYSSSKVGPATPIQDRGWLSLAKSLDGEAVPLSYAELQAIVEGVEYEEGDEEAAAPEAEEEEAGDLRESLNGMDRTQLKQYISNQSLDIQVNRGMTDEDIRDKILATVEE